MERMQIVAQPRVPATKGQLSKLRSAGYVPGVIYGRKTEPLTVAVDSKDITAILHSPSGANTLIDVAVDGGTATVMIKELKREIILTDRFVHVDFVRINLLDKLEVNVPIVLIGEAVGVKEGGVMQQSLREVALTCLPTNIPEHIELDISSLVVGDSLTVADIVAPEGSEFLSEENEVIVSILSPRLEEEEEDAADEDATDEDAEAKESTTEETQE
ncbi:MAG: 50S ribosomal protein L25/general stress protein Ctc [Firmicutes bacterium]|nr:50S ribosomal protein L25/general stress protein Ctc [Bacillota bacterium]